MQRDMDRLFGDDAHLRRAAFPAVNVWQHGETIFAEAEVPGLKLDNLEIFVVGNELSIKGNREAKNGETVYHRRERGAGAFTRVLTLPADVDSNKVEAMLKDGILTLTMPLAETAKARKIAVKEG
jgi:HSP20 family protein